MLAETGQLRSTKSRLGNGRRRHMLWRGGLLVLALLVSTGTVVALASAPTAGQGVYRDLYLPVALVGFEGIHEPVSTARPPTETPTQAHETPVPTDTDAPTAAPTETSGPPPTPTLPWTEVEHSTSADSIIMQIGWTETDQPGEVWEEMNGTPWLTLYGDGRLIAGHKLLGIDRKLYDEHVDEYHIQLWLRKLAHEILFFHMPGKYEHPRGAKPVMHVYVNTHGGENLVQFRGYENYERFPVPEEPDHLRIEMLTELLRDIEAYTTETMRQRYDAEWYTILAQRTHPQMLPNPPRWRHRLNVYAIATAAPTAASNYVDKVVGHKFVKADLGKEVFDYVVPVAQEWWPYFNPAAEFNANARSHAVGARQEVPGGSIFLPAEKRSFWYRSDPGSGTPPYALLGVKERLDEFIWPGAVTWPFGPERANRPFGLRAPSVRLQPPDC